MIKINSLHLCHDSIDLLLKFENICECFDFDINNVFLSFFIILNAWVKQVKPLKESRIALKCLLILVDVNNAIFVNIHSIKDLFDTFAFNFHLTACYDAPMCNDFTDDLSEFFEVKVTSIIYIK